MRKPRGWFEWVKLAAKTAGWVFIIAFVAHWIWEFDRCLFAPEAASSNFGCLLSSLATTYFTWYLSAAFLVYWVITKFV